MSHATDKDAYGARRARGVCVKCPKQSARFARCLECRQKLKQARQHRRGMKTNDGG